MLVLVGLVPILGSPSGMLAASALDRSTADRPDDVGGPQIHAVYMVPSDGEDRHFDTDGSIAASVDAFENWLADQTGGSALRLDTYQGALDVGFFRSAQSDAAIASSGVYVRDRLEAELRAAGLIAPGKIYAVYYDGGSTYSCGGGAWPPELVGSVGAMYLKGTPPGAPPCVSNPFPSAKPWYFEFGMLHEIMHTLGFVPTCALHQTLRGHVSDSPTDLMWSGNAPWDLAHMTLDVNHDDYYSAHIPGCPDFADSPWLVKVPSFSLSVRVSGGGSVMVTPGGMNCTSATPCLLTGLRLHTAVTLYPTALAGSHFTGWSGGGCSGTDNCSLTVSGDTTVTAGFAANPKPKPKPLPKCKKGQKPTQKHPCRR